MGHSPSQTEFLLEEADLAWIPHGITSCVSKPIPVWATLYRAKGIPGKLLQCGFSTGSQLPAGHICLPCRGILPRLHVDNSSSEYFCGLQENILPHHGLQGISAPGCLLHLLPLLLH